jgi:DNA replication licensing factor MCM7
VFCPQVEIHDVNEAMRLIESSKDSLLKQQTNKGYTQNTVDRVYAAIRAMAEGSKTLKIQEIRDRFVPFTIAM